jgi:two-component system, chemotaxis family, chemotaxis protein CheY
VDLTALIINPDSVENRTLSNFLQVRIVQECTAFENENEARAWVSAQTRPVDVIFLCGEAVRSNQKLIDELRSLEQAKFATVFLMVSAEDKEWTNVLASTGEVIDNLLIKPFRVAELIDKVKKALRTTMVKNPALLIVEKEPDDRELLRESLAMLGFSTTYESRDGNDAFEVLSQKEKEIGLVVSGWELPGMNGVQLLKKIRQNPKFATLPFLMVSSQGAIEQAKTLHAAESGVHGYLVRPFDPKTFPGQMETIIQRIEKQHKVGQFLKETKVFEARGTVSHAIDLLHHAVKTLPDAAAIYEALGDVYRISFKASNDRALLSQAVEAYEKALKLEPMCTSIVSKCIETYTELERMKDIIRVTKGYLYKFGFDDALRTKLGKIYLQSGDYGAACVELRRALSVNPFNSEAQSLIQIASELQRGSSQKSAA